MLFRASIHQSTEEEKNNGNLKSIAGWQTLVELRVCHSQENQRQILST
jgi:hypothetical protein